MASVWGWPRAAVPSASPTRCCPDPGMLLGGLLEERAAAMGMWQVLNSFLQINERFCPSELANGRLLCSSG